MRLSEAVYSRMLNWEGVYKQERTLQHAIKMAMSLLLNPSRNTIAQGLIFNGSQDLDWSSSYKLYSRSEWKIDGLFKPIIEETLTFYKDDYISLAVDDTRIKKTGTKIPATQYYRDPMSPPFHANLFRGHRIMQFTALLPLYKDIVPDPEDEDRLYNASRSVPVSYDNVPAVKKPGKRASEEEIEQYKYLKSQSTISLAFLERAEKIRHDYDEAGGRDKKLLIVADGAFCNKTVFKAELDRTDIVARCRRDAKLCFKDTTSSRRFYSQDSFTPESVRKDESIKYKTAHFYLGKKLRKVRYKEVKDVFWQRGAGRKPLRLIVIAPQPYKAYGKRLYHYKREAYLLTNNFDLPVETLIQEYINRWEIEVNHRDEKNNLGLGQAQVWSKESVDKIPAQLVAAYSMMLLASIDCYGPSRSGAYLSQPKWRKGSTRPSCNDLVNLMRKEIFADQELQKMLDIYPGGRDSMRVNQ